jgi:hypothetical protein
MELCKFTKKKHQPLLIFFLGWPYLIKLERKYLNYLINNLHKTLFILLIHDVEMFQNKAISKQT